MQPPKHFLKGHERQVLIVGLSYPLRPYLALHQPGSPDLHRVLGDPPGDGGPLLQDPVPRPGPPWNLRAPGRLLEAYRNQESNIIPAMMLF